MCRTGDADSITFLNGVTSVPPQPGPQLSPGPCFLTGSQASKKLTVTVRTRLRCTRLLFLSREETARRIGGFLAVRWPSSVGLAQAADAGYRVAVIPPAVAGRSVARHLERALMESGVSWMQEPHAPVVDFSSCTTSACIPLVPGRWTVHLSLWCTDRSQLLSSHPASAVRLEPCRQPADVTEDATRQSKQRELPGRGIP